jgi:tetratricopeptide (TPR) repeat protein
MTENSAALQGAENVKPKLVAAILKFLEGEKALFTQEPDTVESLTVACECISRAYQISDSGATNATPPALGLLELFCLGAANYEQIARAIADARGGASAASSTTAVEAQTSTTTTAANATADRAFDDAQLESNFQKYRSMLEKQGYFTGVVSGSADYNTRLAKAREKFRGRFAADNAAAAAATTAGSTATASTSAPVQVSAADAERAEKHKADGNVLLQSKKYDEAVAAYDAAIALNPNVSIYHANKAAALIVLRRFADAAAAAERAVAVDARYAKGWSRLAAARLELDELDAALHAYQQAASIEPANAMYSDGVALVERRMRESRGVVSEPGDGAAADDDVYVGMCGWPCDM